MALRCALRHLLPGLQRLHPSQCQLGQHLQAASPHSHHHTLHSHHRTLHLHHQCLRLYSQAQTQQDSDETVAEEIRNLSPEMKYRLELMKMQHITALSQFRNVLEDPADKDWLYMLKHCKSDQERMKHLIFLQTKKTHKDKAKLKKQTEPQREKFVRTEITYDSIMLRVMESHTMAFRNNNLYHAMVNGPDVVLDMAFCETQPMRAVKRVFIQLGMMIGANKRSRQPFHLHLCGVSDSVTDELYRIVPGLKSMPVTVSKESYLEHYPQEQLVYLSPDAPKVLKEYNANDVYIIGGIVDLAGGKFSYPKAKMEGIRSAKLPIQDYVDWKQGGKSLTLDQVYNILLTAAETNSNWDKAFTHLPRRKLEEKHQVHRVKW